MRHSTHDPRHCNEPSQLLCRKPGRQGDLLAYTSCTLTPEQPKTGGRSHEDKLAIKDRGAYQFSPSLASLGGV